jgi:hypothetical protein
MTPQETLSALKSIIYAKLPSGLEKLMDEKSHIYARTEPQLHHVLMVIEKKIMHGYSYHSVGLQKNLRKPYFQLLSMWNLAVGLDGQKPEVHTFLLNLLT